MTPLEFRNWRERCGFPSWRAVALKLGITERSVKRYAAPETAKTHQPIPEHIKAHCETIDELREARKKPAPASKLA